MLEAEVPGQNGVFAEGEELRHCRKAEVGVALDWDWVLLMVFM